MMSDRNRGKNAGLRLRRSSVATMNQSRSRRAAAVTSFSFCPAIPSIVVTATTVAVLLLALPLTRPASFFVAAKKAGVGVDVDVYNGPTTCEDEDKVQSGNSVAIHFTVSIARSSPKGAKGKKIESSHDGHGFAQAITIGQGRVIRGLDVGLLGLCKGSSARLTVPPHMAYGGDGNDAGGVPGGAVLEYDVEIVDVRPETPPELRGDAQSQQRPKPNEFGRIDANGDGKLTLEEAREYFAAKDQPVDLDSLWKDEDKNGDGSVSWEEFSGSKGDGPPRPKPKKKKENRRKEDKKEKKPEVDVAAQARPVFDELDANKDGTLGREELSVLMAEFGSAMTDEFWEKSDQNNDGSVSFHEFVRLSTQPTLPTTNKQAEIFERLDADNDGRLGMEELSALFAQIGQDMTDEFWNQSDGDGDGFVSWREFAGSDFAGSNRKSSPPSESDETLIEL